MNTFATSETVQCGNYLEEANIFVRNEEEMFSFCFTLSSTNGLMYCNNTLCRYYLHSVILRTNIALSVDHWSLNIGDLLNLLNLKIMIIHFDIILSETF